MTAGRADRAANGVIAQAQRQEVREAERARSVEVDDAVDFVRPIAVSAPDGATAGAG